MWIAADTANFRPVNFEICDYYGKDTCFAWQKNLLAVFPYVQSVSTPTLPLVVAPLHIKKIRCLGGRVFVICIPSGIYKFSRDNQFQKLSVTGVGFGSAYYQVYSPENDWLCMLDKYTKTNKQLIPLEQTSKDCWDICDLTLSATNSDYSLRKALHVFQDGSNEDISIIANGKKVFKITDSREGDQNNQKDVQIIYRGEQHIVDIVGIFDEETIMGFVLVAATSAVMVYVVNEKIVFDKVYFDTEVKGLCAGMNGKSSDTIWIAHIDDSNIYYSVKIKSTDTFRRTGSESKRYLAIRNYKCKVLIGLTDDKQLLECSIEELGLGKNDVEEFVSLNSNMLKGSERLMDEICEYAKDLQLLNENLLEEQDKLKRINIYAHNQAVVLLPDVQVQRIADRMYLRIIFDGVLPTNCHVVAILRSQGQTTYTMKLVEDAETVVDVLVDKDDLDSSLSLGVDLVTLAEESKAWCLIRDFAKSPRIETAPRIIRDRTKFLTAKLAALRNLTSEGNLDMKKLSAMKKSIRKDLAHL